MVPHDDLIPENRQHATHTSFESAMQRLRELMCSAWDKPREGRRRSSGTFTEALRTLGLHSPPKETAKNVYIDREEDRLSEERNLGRSGLFGFDGILEVDRPLNSPLVRPTL